MGGSTSTPTSTPVAITGVDPNSVQLAIASTGYRSCLDALGSGNTNNGARVHQWECIAGHGNQRFQLVPVGGNWYKVRGAAVGMEVL